MGRKASLGERVEQTDFLSDGHRVRLGIRAEHREPDAAIDKPATVTHEARGIGRAVGSEGGDHGREYAPWSREIGHGGGHCADSACV